MYDDINDGGQHRLARTLLKVVAMSVLDHGAANVNVVRAFF